MGQSSMSLLIWYQNPHGGKWVPLVRLNIDKGQLIFMKYTGSGCFREGPVNTNISKTLETPPDFADKLEFSLTV
jgi:hypothetical protein